MLSIDSALLFLFPFAISYLRGHRTAVTAYRLRGRLENRIRGYRFALDYDQSLYVNRPPLPDAELVADIRALVTDLPTYGYRRVHALLRRQAEKTGREAPNPKRVYRVMKVHGLLLQRDGERREERRHDGRVAVDLRNTRWCSDGLEITCDNGEKVRVAFALDCCDREAMGHVATTGGITAEDVQDLMVATVEHRYGQVNRVPEPIEWLTDNGSCYTARNTRQTVRKLRDGHAIRRAAGLEGA